VAADGGLAINFADIFEFMADTVPDRPFLVAGDARLTYAETDARAARAARLLREAGVRPGDHVGIYAVNRAEWVEAMLGCLKLRAVPVNVNYRYVAAELRYLLGNAAPVCIVVERRYLATLADVLPGVPTVRAVVVLEDGTPADGFAARPPRLADRVLLGYEDEPADTAPVRVPRSGDDQLVIYTGGTTGMPKGVIWRSEDLFHAAIRRPLPDGSIPDRVEDLLTRHAASAPVPSFTLAPLMHGVAQLSVLSTFSSAGTAVLWTGRRFSAPEILRIAAAERTVSLAMVGDAMAVPILDTLEADPGGYDLSALAVVASSGAPLSDAARARFRIVLPKAYLYNGYGGSELGHSGGEAGEPRRFRLSADAAVLDDKLRPVVPGSGQVGRIARSGPIPIGYYKDPAKTAATFLTDADGVRWVVPGDLARVETDGTAVLLGRENTVVNTGGEKVFPEEVENALKDYGEVADAVVVGVPDPRFGERVVALVVARAPHEPDVAALERHCRGLVAGYKVPREIHVVSALTRSPAGKLDIRWARETAARLSSSRSLPS